MSLIANVIARKVGKSIESTYVLEFEITSFKFHASESAG